MATIDNAADLRTAPPARIEAGQYPPDSRVFDFLSIATSVWFVAGIILDNWAHNHFSSIETFFTPWHAVLYSGSIAVAGLIGFTTHSSTPL